MLPSNSRNERSPLRAVTNTANSPLTRKAGSTPVKKTNRNAQKAPLPRMSLPLPPSDSRDKGSDNQKKLRSSLNKRVSFGGNSINVFYKQSEFSPQENEPAIKALRTTSRSSPSPRRNFSRSRILPAEDEDVPNDDTVSMPSVPVLQDDSYFPDRDPSPPVNENPSPVPVRRDSTGFHDRQSFGLFIDEDITMGERDVIRDDQDDDMTIEFPRLNAARSHRISNASVLSDGDITQSLYGLIPKMLQDEDLCDNNGATRDVNEHTSPPNPSADAGPGDAEMKMLDIAQHEHSEPITAAQPVNVPLSEMENERSYSGNNDSSGTTVRRADQERTQEHHIEPMSIRADVDEANESSQCPSPAVPVRVRPVPPNCRKLFDSDANEDEDNTLHYHDKPGCSANGPGATQSNPLGVPVLHSTPMSETQSKLRSVIEERASASGKRNAASKLRELSSSALRSSQPGPVQDDESVENSFSFRDFLQGLQLNFGTKAATRQRGQSLAPQNYATDNFPRSSFEGEVLESVRKATVLETFKRQIDILRAKIPQHKHNIEVLDHKIESTRPPLFSKMAELETMPVHETTAYRISMKRLRKLATLKNKEAWVVGRKVWETDLLQKLKASITDLGQYNASLCDSVEENRALNSLFIEQIAGMGLGGAFTEERSENDSTEEDNKERAELIQEVSLYRDIRGYVDSVIQEEEDLAARRARVTPEKLIVSKASKELRTMQNPNRKRITEQAELNSIVAGVCGVNLTRVNKNSISLRAVGIMDIQFSLHDEKVINTSCKTVPPSNEVSCPVWQPYMDGAVSLVNWDGGVKNVKYVRDIPSALFRCTTSLSQARLVYEDAAHFLDRNMGRIVSGGLRRGEGTPSLDLTMEASFYSLSLRCKFDVTLTVTTRLPTNGSPYLVQEATVGKVHRHFGDKPEDKVITDTLIKSGRRDFGEYSLADGLAAVWRSLS